MIRALQRILFGIAAALVVADLVWAGFGRFQIDESAYGRLALITAGLFALGIYYDRRRDRRIGAMLLATSFLCAFSAAASLFNYFLLPVSGARIDDTLALIDRAVGVNWISLMRFAAAHPQFNRVLHFAYGLLLPEIALLVPVLAWDRPVEEVYRFCLALAVGAIVTIAVWTLAPSFGAFSVYQLPVSLKLDLALDGNYARALVALLKDGPGFISPGDIRGLIGFPSYHAVLAMLVVWYAWQVLWLRMPALIVNALVLVATPIQGGHHVIDVVAALPVVAVAVGAVRITGLSNGTTFAGKVNGVPKFTFGMSRNALFRSDTAQSAAHKVRAIKPTLSHLP